MGFDLTAFLEGVVSRKLHLHAREIQVPHPNGTILHIRAPLPNHMLATWKLFGFDANAVEDPFDLPGRAAVGRVRCLGDVGKPVDRRCAHVA